MKQITTTGRGWKTLFTKLSALFLFTMLCIGFSACQNTTATTSSNNVVKNLIAGNTYSYKNVQTQTQDSVTIVSAYVQNITFSSDDTVKIVTEQGYGSTKDDAQIETDTMPGTYTTNDSDYTATLTIQGSTSTIKVAADGQSITVSQAGESMTLSKGATDIKDLFIERNNNQENPENPNDSSTDDSSPDINLSGIEVFENNDGTYNSTRHELTFGKKYQGAGVYCGKNTSEYNAIILTYKNATNDFRFIVSYSDDTRTETVALQGSGTAVLLLDSSKAATSHYIMFQSETDTLSVQLENLKLTKVNNYVNLDGYELWKDENGEITGEYNKTEHTINVTNNQGGGVWTGLDTSDYNTLTLTYRYASSDFCFCITYADKTTNQITAPAGTYKVSIPIDSTKTKDDHYIQIVPATNNNFYVQLIDLKFENKERQSENAETLFTITYDANDDTIRPAKEYQSVTEAEANSTITLRANTFKREGYHFIGWSTFEILSAWTPNKVDYKDQATVSFTKDITLYAVWAQDTFTITYNANDGSSKPATKSQTITLNDLDSNSEFTLIPNTFTRGEYIFKGWGSSPSGTDVGYKDGEKTSSITGDVTLYAIWTTETNQLVITFNANDGSENPATTTQEVDAHTWIKLNKNTFTRSGYKFIGWDYFPDHDPTTTLIEYGQS